MSLGGAPGAGGFLPGMSDFERYMWAAFAPTILLQNCLAKRLKLFLQGCFEVVGCCYRRILLIS